MARFTLPRDIYHGKDALDALKTFKGKRAMICVGGEHDDRDFGVLADFAADLPAVHFGHHDVEDDEGDVFLGVEGVYGLFAVTGFDDVVSGFY